jgi:RpiB/LacA/LacB family sugar-phosphate isomerase
MPEHPPAEGIVVLGADHAGYELKDHLAALLRGRGVEVLDVGTTGPEPVDYPDFAEAVARAVQDGQAWRGVVVCGSGTGACITANKLHGVRAALAHDTYTAHQAVEHDDANVLCLGARIVGTAVAEELLDAFLGGRFTGEARHQRRLDKVNALEAAATPRTPTH